MPTTDHKNLMKTLNKLVRQERWRKIPKAKGEVVRKSLTKNGNIKIILKTGKKEIIFYVLKRNKNLYEEASKVEAGEMISAALRTQLGKYYGVKLSRSEDKQLQKWFCF